MKKIIFVLLLLVSPFSLAVNKIIVPNIAGGSVDLLARKFAEYTENITKKSFIIENNGGAGGIIGFTNLIQSKPNTLMISSSSWYIALVENKFQLKDFKPISVLAEAPLYLMVHTSSKLTCEKLKTSGTNYFIGSGGSGSQTSIVANFLIKEFNYITEIPYKSVKPSVLDLLGNQIHGTIIASTTDLQEPLMLLANSSKYTINGVPSFKECFGIEKTALGQFILIANLNSDEKFIVEMNDVAKRFVDDINIKKYYYDNGLVPKVTDSKKTKALIDSELVNWNNILK
jgi:tripartite-type tricarboxylate transporter receptor subunit TctC